MARLFKPLAVLAVVVVSGCHHESAHRAVAPGPLHWEIKPGLWRSDYIDGDGADASCVGPHEYSSAPPPPTHGGTILRFLALPDGFVADARCQTDYRPNLIRNETRALNSDTVLITFSQKTEGEPGPALSDHTRMTFIGACPNGWREGDWLDLKPIDGRWRVLRMPATTKVRTPEPVVVIQYQQLPPELARPR
jgi:hypothetical protein